MSALLARVLILTALIAITGCAERDPRCASLPGGGRYCLQPTTALAPFDAQQKIEVFVNGHRETLIVEIESDANGLRCVGLTPFGVKLMEVSYDNYSAKLATPTDSRLDPALLVALLQLSLWPTNIVRSGLSAALILEETDNGRRILSGDNTLLMITSAGMKLPYQHIHLTIPSMSLELDVDDLGALPMAGKDQ
jgi:hypothetical protein